MTSIVDVRTAQHHARQVRQDFLEERKWTYCQYRGMWCWLKETEDGKLIMIFGPDEAVSAQLAINSEEEGKERE